MSRTLTLLIIAIICAITLMMVRTFKSTSSADKALGASSMQPDPKFHDWREFSPASGRFKVFLPALPQHVSDKIADPKTQEIRKYDTYIAGDTHGGAFMISAITFAHKAEGESDEELLKAVVNDMLTRNKDNKLNSMTPGKFHNVPSLDFSITSGDLLINGKVFSQSNSVYVLSMINNNNSYNPKVMDFFVNSFEMVHDKTPVPAVPATPEKNPVAK